ncbi:MAG: molecular chaperone TorD family protein [Caldilineaceae bacterium]|nr:molecular chaperone TorD family protein [Caldilineaceae bacterium]
MALARGRLYELCRQLYLEGVTVETAAVVKALPDFAAYLFPDQHETVDNVLERTAATHQELFGFNLFSYESMFLENAGLLNGEGSDAVAAAYRAFGYAPTMRAGAPDHLGEELGALAHLCTAEADAWEDGNRAIAQRMQREERQFLQTHLLRWLYPCVTAIQRHEDPFFAYVATVTAELTAAHYAALVAVVPTETPVARPVWALPAPPTLLQDARTSLKDIAHFLITPVYSGIFLSRASINRLGRTQRLPRGFGSREQMLTNLLRTAAQYELLSALLGDLVQEFHLWQQTYQNVLTANAHLAEFVKPWLTRAGATVELLAEMDKTLMHTGELFDR